MFTVFGYRRSIKNYLLTIGSEDAGALHDERMRVATYDRYLAKRSIFSRYFSSKPDASYHPSGGIQVLQIDDASILFPDYDQVFYKSEKQKCFIRNRSSHEQWDEVRVSSLIGRIQTDHPEIFDLLSKYIRVIVLDCLEPHGSASASDGLGLISINCKNHYEDEDVIEMIVHELVHNLFFVEMIAVPCFHEGIDPMKELIFSPIRKQKRALPLALHALFVGVELLALRTVRGTSSRFSRIHPDTRDLLESCTVTLDELKLKQVFSNDGNRMLSLVGEKLSSLRKELYPYAAQPEVASFG